MSKNGKGGGCKVFVMFLVGILFGIILTVGGLAGAGYWAYNNLSIKKLEQIIGTKIVNLGEYNDKPIKDLINEVQVVTNMTIDEIDDKLLDGNIKKNLVLELNGNKIDLTKSLFSGILDAKISTVTDEVGKIKDHLTFGFVYDDILINAGLVLPNSPFYQKYKNTSLEETLQNYGSEKISTFFEAGHDFGNDAIKALYDAFSSKNLTFDDLNDHDKVDDALNGIKIADILGIDDSATGVLKAIKDWTFEDFSDSSKFDTLEINDILTLDEHSTGVLGAIFDKNWTLGDLKDSANFDTLKINDILDLDNTSTGVLGAIYAKDWALSDLKDSSSFDSLKVNDILELDEHSTGVLKSLYDKDYTLAELKDDSAFDELKINDILGLDEHSTGIHKALYIKDWKISDLKDSAKFDTLSVNDILGLTSSSTGVLKAIQAKNWTLADLKDSTKFDTLSVNDILGIDEHSTGVLKAIGSKNWTLANLKNSSSFDTLEVNDILGLTSSSTGILKAIQAKGWTLADLKDSSNFDTLEVNDVLGLTSSSTGILKAIFEQGWTLADLKDDSSFDLLSVNDVLGLTSSSTGILGAIYGKNWTLEDLKDSSKLDGLTLGEIIEIDSTSPKMLTALQNTSISNLSSDISTLRLADVMDLGAKNYKTDPGLAEPDSYKGFIGLLYETDADDKGPKLTELATKLNSIHVNNITLGEMQSRELISSSSDLTKILNGRALSTYTMQELIDFVITIAS